MADVIQTLDGELALLPDNTARLISPQRARELLLSAWGAVQDFAPTMADDNANTAGHGFFDFGSKWTDKLNKRFFFCFDGTPNAAVWWEVRFFQNPLTPIITATLPIHATFIGPDTYNISSDAPLPPASLLSQLAAYWTLNEAGGTRSDQTANYDLLDIGTTPTSTTAGVIGLAADMISANGNILQATSPIQIAAGESMTVAGWLYLDVAVSGNQQFQNGQGNYSSTGALWLTSAGVPGYCFVFAWASDNSVSQADVNTLSAGWQFIRAWYDASDRKVRIKINETSLSVGAALTADLVVLGSAPGVGLDRAGLLSNTPANQLGVWSRVLTDDEGVFLYNSGVGRTYPFTSANPNVPANYVQAGPAAGADGPLTPRLLVPADLPTIDVEITSAPMLCPLLTVAGLHGTITTGSQSMTGINAADVLFLEPGMALSGGGLVGGTTLLDIDQGAGTGTISTPATATGTTAFDATPIGFEWAELRYNPDTAAPSINPSGRTGTVSTGPVFAENFTVPPIGTHVQIRPRNTVAASIPTWTFRCVQLVAGSNIGISKFHGDRFTVSGLPAPTVTSQQFDDAGSAPPPPPAGSITLFQIGGVLQSEDSAAVITPVGTSPAASMLVRFEFDWTDWTTAIGFKLLASLPPGTCVQAVLMQITQLWTFVGSTTAQVQATWAGGQAPGQATGFYGGAVIVDSGGLPTPVQDFAATTYFGGPTNQGISVGYDLQLTFSNGVGPATGGHLVVWAVLSILP